MLTLRWVLSAIVAASAVSASTDELQFFSRLLKRQDPGTPEYNCHDNCGQAIIQARNSDDVCSDDVFLTDYKNCLQCSGPDNVDIWKYYGGSLSTAAEPCGLSTTPLEGEQPDVGPATPAGGSSDDTTASTSQEATSSATSAPIITSTAEEESSAAPTTTADETTEAPTSTAEEGAPSETQETTATTGYATELPSSTGESVSAISTEYATSTDSSATGSGYVTSAPSATQGGNGTATSTTITNAANALPGSFVGFYGALALGAWYAVAQ